jgi:hypothetical protein
MRRFLVFSLVAVCAIYFLWRTQLTRSTTIQLEDTGYGLTYSVAWGLGMEERFAVSRWGGMLPGSSSGWLEIWDKPYNAVLTVYRTLDGKTYYFGTGWLFVFTFDPISGEIKRFCGGTQTPMPQLTALGAQLRNRTVYTEAEATDPAPRLRSYVNAQDRGAIPISPSKSRYYADLLYLGKFGVIGNIHGRGRGEDVGFVPADKAAEPRFGLDANCG